MRSLLLVAALLPLLANTLPTDVSPDDAFALDDTSLNSTLAASAIDKRVTLPDWVPKQKDLGITLFQAPDYNGTKGMSQFRMLIPAGTSGPSTCTDIGSLPRSIHLQSISFDAPLECSLFHNVDCGDEGAGAYSAGAGYNPFSSDKSLKSDPKRDKYLDTINSLPTRVSCTVMKFSGNQGYPAFMGGTS